ncbi:hypothetical protein AO984_30205 [Pseudomonas aeruginosa]|nr:hypothetical protein AO984_30205 [Pseudomonas aeruginosa]
MPGNPSNSRRRWRLSIALALTLLAGTGGAVLLTKSLQQNTRPETPITSKSGPPWIYGHQDARYMLVAYTDFECPYCQTYIPQLLRWVETTDDVALQWHHLPLASHEPVASGLARMAECQGEVGGSAAFWKSVRWIYAHTRGGGQGPAAKDHSPGITPAVQACLSSERPAAIVRAQAAEAATGGINVTPTLRLKDSRTGRMLKLEGAVDQDTLLSALDWLSQPEEEGPAASTAF